MDITNIAKNKINSLLKINKSKIPKNAFGVFVTIRRSVKLPNYPEDIHGCIGFWTNNYSILSYKELVSHLMDVANSAIYNDKRREYFPPIETDLDTIIEIDFMLKPLITINSNNGLLPDGTKFKNSQYGLIVEGINGSRATYLPNVFPDTILWSKLKKSLISKAGGKENQNNKFLAYKIIQLKGKIFDVII